MGGIFSRLFSSFQHSIIPVILRLTKNLLHSKCNFGCLPSQFAAVMPDHKPDGPQAIPDEKNS